ncbi:polyprenyl synthetase family protein, partial [bacterium]|nr:polyprenyl synthetase family protein [bacterium]
MGYFKELQDCRAIVNSALDLHVIRGGHQAGDGFPDEGFQPVPGGAGLIAPGPSGQDNPLGNNSERLLKAQEYALSGGKRLRPCLLFFVAAMLGRDPMKFIRAACAVECVHASSLILDDLPCMDNSQTRREKPSLHSEFDEATAILVAVSLLTRGFALLSEN